MRKSIFIISLISSIILLILYSVVIYFYYNDRIGISRDELFNNFGFTKELFLDKEIDKILFNIDTSEITVYFPSEQSTNVIDFFTRNKWNRYDAREYIKFYNEKTVVYLNKGSMEIRLNSNNP